MKRRFLPPAVLAFGLAALPAPAALDDAALRAEFGRWEVQATAGESGRIDAICDLGHGVVVFATRKPNPGKLYLSENYGETWSPLPSPTGNAITCLTAADRNRFYLLTDRAEVFGTRDGGRTWRKLRAAMPNRSRVGAAAAYGLMVTPHGTLLMSDTDSDGGHVYRSIDDGETWSDLGIVSPDALYRFMRVGNGIVLNGFAGAVYKSTDDGRTWIRQQQLGTSALFATEYLGASYVLQADQAGRVYRSGNLGETWEQVATLDGSADDFIDLGFGAVYYSTYTGARDVYLSLNYGQDWLKLGPLPESGDEDWLDHGIRLDAPDFVVAIGGTIKGRIVRNVIARDRLHEVTTRSRHRRPMDVLPELRRDLDAALVDRTVDFAELAEPEDVLLHAGHAYVPCRSGNNVAIFRLQDDERAEWIGSIRDLDILDTFGVAAEGRHLFVLSMTNAMVSIFDISDPGRPVKTGAVRVGGEGARLDTAQSSYTRLRKIAVRDGLAFVTHSSESKVYILDVANPAKPVVISEFPTGDGAFAVLPHRHALYLAGYGPGSSVIAVDIRDPRHPQIVDRDFDRVELQGTCALAIEGDTLYAVAYNAGTISAYDVSDPLRLKRLSRFKHDGMRGPGRIAVRDGTAYVISSTNDTLAVFDITNPAKPKPRYFVQDLRIKMPYGIATDSRYLYLVARQACSFVVLDRSLLDATSSMVKKTRADGPSSALSWKE